MESTRDGAEPLSPDAIPGFWRRPLALTVDIIVLAASGATLGAFQGPFFASIGPSARFFGLAITVMYFTILNSRLLGGQTAGKRLLGIRAVGEDGNLLSVGRSMGRALVLLVPFSMSGDHMPVFGRTGFETVLSFGAGGAFVYLYIFNRPTRQSLHDVTAGR